MRSRARTIVLFAGAASVAAALAACIDEPTRAGFDAVDPPDANLPETAPPVDAGPAPDARPPFDPTPGTVACAGDPCALELVAGDHHFCARMKDGTVRCWGDDDRGALGRGDGADAGDAGSAAAQPVVGLAGATQISAGGRTTCARVDDGGVRCWGANVTGELGLAVDPPVADEDPHPTPEPVALAEPALRVDVGHGSACAVLTSGGLACWGRDEHAQLARGAAAVGWGTIRGPGLAETGKVAFALARTGNSTSLGLTKTGELWSWGALAGDEGLLSGRVASISPDSTPKRIVQLAGVTGFALSPTVQPDEGEDPKDPVFGPGIPGGEPPPPRAHACAIAGGEVYCWGRSDTGALCTGLPDREVRPAHAPVRAKHWPQQIAVSDEITCVRMTDGAVMCCGSDLKGRLGTGTVGVFSTFLTPAKAFTGHAVQVATSLRAVCALVKDGTVACWGGNQRGELGLVAGPDDLPHPTPTKVAF